MFRVFTEYEICYLTTNDWRTELYFLGLENPNKAFAKNYYAAELNAEWPKIYDVKRNANGSGTYGPIYTGAYRTDLAVQNYEYWLDFLEGSQGGSESVSQFSVNNIGRRVTIGKDKTANCIFPYEFPNFIIYPVGQESDIKETNAILVKKELYDKMTLGGGQISAFDKAKELLIQHTQYNEAVTIATIPIYYLEPNTVIHIEDNDVAVNGDYIINTISLPLTIGTSNISCTRCLSKTI